MKARRPPAAAVGQWQAQRRGRMSHCRRVRTAPPASGSNKRQTAPPRYAPTHPPTHPPTYLPPYRDELEDGRERLEQQLHGKAAGLSEAQQSQLAAAMARQELQAEVERLSGSRAVLEEELEGATGRIRRLQVEGGARQRG